MPPEFIETSTVQAGLIDTLSSLGWRHVRGRDLDRTTDEVFIKSDVVRALTRLNPEISAVPERVDEILPRIRSVLLSAHAEGLPQVNQRLRQWLLGLETHHYNNSPGGNFAVVRLIDFDNPAGNDLVVSDEVTLSIPGHDPVRFDLVLFINGFPLVVVETKTPVREDATWFQAAREIHETYQRLAPGFFAPNVLSVASEGKELRYGSITQSPEEWLTWGSTTDDGQVSLDRVFRDAALMLTPEMVLRILRDYTLFLAEGRNRQTRVAKILPRYFQVEAVEAILQRVLDPIKKQGLIWHYQGSGKTFEMAFAAGKLRREASLEAPTILAVFDSLDLIEQTTSEFRAAGVESIKVAKTRKTLCKMLLAGESGVIMTTVFRFKDAGLLSERSNIVVLVDEAHRTQSGILNKNMHSALPNANFIGFTGTPLSEVGRNTFDSFGDPDDHHWVLSEYTMQQSISDGNTLPIKTENRVPMYHLDKAILDAEFAKMADEADLSEEEMELVARRANSIVTLMVTPPRLQVIAEDFVNEYRQKHKPLGQAVMLIAQDREMCVLYHQQIKMRLRDDEECAVVMTVESKDPEDYQEFELSRAEEAAIKRRIKDPSDPLKILIVTAKLQTGFNAPNLGAIGIDKTLRDHTLFQAMTRVNRPWTNPITKQSKSYGRIIDYIGLGAKLVTALGVTIGGTAGQEPYDIQELCSYFLDRLQETLRHFDGLDQNDSSYAVLSAAQQRLTTDEASKAFAKDYLELRRLFEFLWPQDDLLPARRQYLWLTKIYNSMQPAKLNLLLWQKFGAKTQAIVDAAVGGFEIAPSSKDKATIDATVMRLIKDIEGRIYSRGDLPQPTLSKQDTETMIQTIRDQIEAKIKQADSHIALRYSSLADRLDLLRQMQLATAEESQRFLKMILALATEKIQLDKETTPEEEHIAVLAPDPRRRALTQIFVEYKPDYAPDILERIVNDIDRIVVASSFQGWQERSDGDKTVKREIRKMLKSYGLEPTGELFERVYAYVRENY